ncbi:MAG TPA: serine hydrolase domain-containing protein, partial [Herpetosiphonaceae bacterium]
MLNIYRIERRIQQAIQERRYVGLALALVHGAEMTYARGFGTTSVEDGGIAVTPDTLFCIGSISKSLTATLVMRLVEQGRLDLDQPVIHYLPGFAFSDRLLGARITLRHVLSHSTGLPAAGKDFGPRDPDALRRFVWEDLPRYQFIAEPGKVHLYNNT